MLIPIAKIIERMIFMSTKKIRLPDSPEKIELIKWLEEKYKEYDYKEWQNEGTRTGQYYLGCCETINEVLDAIK